MAPLVWTLLVALAAASKHQPEVTTPAGTFRGRTLTSFSGADYFSYRGIPYALPPTGDRRFALPVPHPVIEGVHDAGQFGPICLQLWRGSRLGQEDCLYLNVFTPLDGQTTAHAGLKKVLFYIHEGGFVIDSSNLYLPGDLVTRVLNAIPHSTTKSRSPPHGDLVVVTINYRLGWMGFMRGNSSSLQSNVALWDQLLALKWVRDNIRHFGGDPSDVTLSGTTVGSMSASILSLSPLCKGLFSKVIMFSGTANFFPAPPRTNNDLLQIAADKFGCSVGSLAGHEDAVVACLKQVPAEDFLKDFAFPLILTGVSSGDDLIPRPFTRALNDTGYLKEIGYFDRDYLASITADDGYILVNSIYSQINTTSHDSIDYNNIWWLDLPKSVIKLLFIEYQKLFGDLDKSVTAVVTDFIFLTNIFDFLDAYGRRQEQCPSKKQAYLMSFDHITKYVPNHYVLEVLDICYLFDLTPKDLINLIYLLEPEDVFYDEDREMKATYIDMVVDFVKTGNPGVRLASKKGVSWPPYDPDQKSYLSLSLKPFVGKDLLGKRRVIWEKLLPQWLEEEKRCGE